MRSRSARSFSRAAKAACLAALLLAAPRPAWALLTITSRQSTGVNDKFYFAGIAGGGELAHQSGASFGSWADPDPDFDFKVVDLTATQSSEVGGATNGIVFTIKTDKPSIAAPSGNPVLVVVLRLFATADAAATTAAFAPIAAAGPANVGLAAC